MTHKIASAPAIESAVITQKTMTGYALPLSLAIGYRWVATQEGVACNINVSSVTNDVRVFGLGALTVVLGPDRARLLAGGSYDLANRADHKLGSPPG